MNLQEFIRKVLREELKPNLITVMRRVNEIELAAKTMLDIYETDLGNICKYGIDRIWKTTYIRVATHFKNKYFTDIMTASNEWGRICVFIEKYMEENGFKDQLIKIYNKKCTEIQESTRIVKEEMTKEVKWLLRRSGDPEIMDDLKDSVRTWANFFNPCGRTKDEFLDDVMELSVNEFIKSREELDDVDDLLPIDKLVYQIIYENYKGIILRKYETKREGCN